VELFERPSAARGEPLLEAWSPSGALALATPAEADALLRVLREGPDRARLEPRSQGVVSFVGRGALGGDDKAGETSTWRELGRGLRQWEGTLELEDGIQADVDMSYESLEQTARAREVLDRLVVRLRDAEGPLRALADSVRLAPRERTLGVRFKVSLEILAALDAGAATR
jgi:hypothetical protein